ncbi:mitotic checkpoint regulator, MAD2B-interacting-domain-containing protein [Boeremia exigua]|uniref:mitotic checkpoint regulator, MAD2B-interacting-domain-containing protein n=1 Tax=Boeremia exigua TaxID=749465 RepID=UPI001E8CEE1F|nr:mitotic checkpoint regulator, MAD2B-interacting-domain-containing protein [Boeremia exigua]KAH6625705.1 mitotic checkpoint regulator, MAD2B-interacting-domain-containing protein [Boeremia exigua]
MNLTAYSDSESDGDAPAPVPAPKPAPKTFQKVVDRANPGRIKLSLPGASSASAPRDDIESEAPPAKKARVGGGGLGGFNSMLPAPKKANVKAPAAATPGSRGLGKGLGAGINLRTGAEPAFKREPKLELEEYDEQGNVIKKEPMNKEDFRAMLNLPTPKSAPQKSPTPDSPAPAPDAAEGAPPKPAAPRFVPMSVGKGKKKKPAARPAPAPAQESKPAPVEAPPPKPKVSLFGVSQEAEAPTTNPGGAYQPIMYGFDEDEEDDDQAADETFNAQPAHHPTQYAPTPAAPNELTNIASELNLSEAERRQLFGKKGRNAPDFSSAKIVQFNTDTEYAHNELLRQQGEQAQHNPLKSISGTGKNSLRSLVSSATTQKDALEEHFAAGYRNKKEAGNRYGW